MKKRTLKKICDYWESEARRNAAEAAAWRTRFENAARELAAIRRDPLSNFTAAFRCEAMRQIDAWPQGAPETATTERQAPAGADDPLDDSPASEPLADRSAPKSRSSRPN
jgi:hypothetical protein